MKILQNILDNFIDLTLILIPKFLLVCTENMIEEKNNAFTELPTAGRLLKEVCEGFERKVALTLALCCNVVAFS